MAYAIYAQAKHGKDSSKLGIQFNADSTFIELPADSSKSRKFYVKDEQIFLQDDSTFKPYQLSFKGDSTATIISKDSLFVVLKKK